MMNVMSMSIPAPREAQASLAEAATRASLIRKADTPLVLALLAQATAMLAAGLTLGLVPRGPGQGILLVVVACGGLCCMIIALTRLRATSRIGYRWFNVATLLSAVWTSLVLSTSVSLHWFTRDQPWHFTVSMAATTVPQLVAAALIRGRGIPR